MCGLHRERALVATNDEALIPLAQAAQHLGVPYITVYTRVRQGRLRATLVKNKLMVSTTEVERYREAVMGYPVDNTRRGRRLKNMPDAE